MLCGCWVCGVGGRKEVEEEKELRIRYRVLVKPHYLAIRLK